MGFLILKTFSDYIYFALNLQLPDHKAKCKTQRSRGIIVFGLWVVIIKLLCKFNMLLLFICSIF